jgi:hypothetical protein
MKTFVITILFSFATLLYANTIGIVQKVEGIVKVKQKDSIKKTKVKVGYEIKSGDIISTFRKSGAVLKLNDKSVIVLKDKATISFLDKNEVSQNEGKIYYKITSRDVKNKLKIKTNFAIIGIKGTTFIINADDKESYVALKEGLIGVESIKEEFRLYKKKVMDEFEAYKKEQQKGFEEYKSAGEEYVLEVTKSFDLQEGNVVSFDEDKVVEDKLQNDDDFKEFEDFFKD